MPRVFITYSHDSNSHVDRVLALADRLREDGLDVRLDQYELHVPEGWIKWMERQLEEADFVIVVCTETYRRRFDGKEAAGVGLAATLEGSLVQQIIFDAGSQNHRFIPILFEDGKVGDVPRVLGSATRYQLHATYDDLYRHLTGQPKTPPPPIGKIRPMPPAPRPGLAGAGAPTSPTSTPTMRAQSFRPQRGAVGQWVYVSGQGFVDGRTTVSFGGIDGIAAKVYDETSLGFTIPTTPSNIGRIGVIVDGFTSWTPLQFTVAEPVEAPIITGVSPLTAVPGAWIHLHGENFVEGKTRVRVGTTTAPRIAVYGPEQLGFEIPKAPAGEYQVCVETDRGKALSHRPLAIVSGPLASSSPTAAPTPTPDPLARAKILLVTANASDQGARLLLEEESRAIIDALQRARLRDRYDLRLSPAITFDRLVHDLDDHAPPFVHFSGHGDRDGALILQTADRYDHRIPPENIRQLFAALRRRPELVVFATCYSRDLAERVAPHVGYAIGFTGMLGDRAARHFSAVLYERLAAHEPPNIARAFTLARIATVSAGYSEADGACLFDQTGRSINLSPQPTPASADNLTDIDSSIRSRIIEAIAAVDDELNEEGYLGTTITAAAVAEEAGVPAEQVRSVFTELVSAKVAGGPIDSDDILLNDKFRKWWKRNR